MNAAGDAARPWRWRLASLADVPAHDDWLTPVERVRLAGLRLPKRRADWRLGRWVGKQAVGAALGCDPPGVAIIAGESGAPLALRDGVPAPVTISLSHAGGRGLCAVAPAGVALGCDLEPLAPRSAAFVREWFTPAEQRRIGADGELATVYWCAKEAVLKALGDGLRRDPREVEVAPAAGAALSVGCDGRRFEAWWFATGGCVAVVALKADPSP